MNYFEVWIGDWLRKTMSLSMGEQGAYFLLVLSYFSERQALPADYEELYGICKAKTTSERKQAKKVIDKYFPIEEDGLRHNSKCDEKIEEFTKKIQTARSNGANGGRPRNSNENGGEKTDVGFSGLPNENPNESSSIPNPQSPGSFKQINAREVKPVLPDNPTDTERAVFLLTEIRIPHADQPRTVSAFEERSLRGLIAHLGFEKIEKAISTCGEERKYGTIQQIRDLATGKTKPIDSTKQVAGKRNGYSMPERNTTSPAYKPYIGDKNTKEEAVPMTDEVRELMKGMKVFQKQ